MFVFNKTDFSPRPFTVCLTILCLRNGKVICLKFKKKFFEVGSLHKRFRA